MRINELAPVTSTQHISIEATPEAVWAILTSIPEWPTWNAAVSECVLEGPLQPGAKFRWRSGGLSIRSTFQEVRPPRSLAWTGKAIGTFAVHVWTLEPEGNAVRVSTSESLEGWLVTLFRSRVQQRLEVALEALLEALKTAAESRSHPPSDPAREPVAAREKPLEPTSARRSKDRRKRPAG